MKEILCNLYLFAEHVCFFRSFLPCEEIQNGCIVLKNVQMEKFLYYNIK